jgi:hypothetical protein
MTGTPVFPSVSQQKYISERYAGGGWFLTDGHMQNVQLGTLATMPPVAQVTANANRIMLGMHPIW